MQQRPTSREIARRIVFVYFVEPDGWVLDDGVTIQPGGCMFRDVPAIELAEAAIMATGAKVAEVYVGSHCKMAYSTPDLWSWAADINDEQTAWRGRHGGRA